MQTLAHPIGFTAVDALRNFFSNEKSIVRMQRFFMLLCSSSLAFWPQLMPTQQRQRVVRS